jgi:hypothetical protein
MVSSSLFAIAALIGLWTAQAATITTTTSNGLTSASISPISTEITTCKIPSRTPFDIYALKEDGSTYPVRLVKTTTTDGSIVANMIVSTNSVCNLHLILTMY